MTHSVAARVNTYISLDISAENTVNKQISTNINQILSEYLDLIYEYNVLRASIAQNKQDQEKIKIALKMAALFTELHENYLNVPREASRFRHEQREYEKLLNYQKLSDPLHKDLLFSPWVRNKTRTISPARLLVSRSRRLIIMMNVLFKQFTAYCQLVNLMEQYSAPFFMHQSWAWFLPRLSMDLFLIAKHTAYCPLWLSNGEQQLTASTRFNAQLAYRWRNLSNDIPWLIAGLATCFFLTGPLLPMVAYLSLAMQCYDLVVFGCLIPYFESLRFKRILDNNQDDIYFKDKLEERIAFDNKSYSLQTKNFCGLTFATALMLPELALINPYIPLIGASLMVLVTLITWLSQEQINRERDNIYDVKFFNEKELDSTTGIPSPVSVVPDV